MDDDTYPILDHISESKAKLSTLSKRRDGFSRNDVVNALNNSFHMIGGVTRMALWANENPDKFYPLYARLMPSNTLNISVEGEKVTIVHAIGPTELDRHPGDPEGRPE